MSIKTRKKLKWLDFILLLKKNPEISFRHGPEHETTSLRVKQQLLPRDLAYL